MIASRRTTFVGSLRVLSAVMMGWAAAASSLSADPLVDEVVRALEQRAEQRNPIHVRYVLTKRVTKEHYAARKRPVKDDVRFTVQGEHIEKGVKVKSVAKGGPFGDKERFYLWNGEISIRPSADDGFFVSRKKRVLYESLPPWRITYEDGARRRLKAWKEKKGKFIVGASAKRGIEEGKRLVTVELRSADKNRWLIQFLPDRGYPVKQIQCYDEKGRMRYEAKVRSFQDVDGLVVATSGVAKRWYAGTLREETKFDVTDVVRGASNVSDDLFVYDIPKDAVVFDEDLNVPVRRSDQAQSHLDEMLERAGQRSRWWKEWLWVGIALLCLLALAVGGLWWRRRRRLRLSS